MLMKTIEEGNKLIDCFMNYPDGYKMPNVHGNYHTSWDWLMPVVEKIESLQFSFYIVGKCCYLNDKPPSMFGESKIQAVYLKVVEFIEWYNATL